jgi:hypothetical protein
LKTLLVKYQKTYNIDNNKPVVENIFRPGSNQYFNLIKEARILFDNKQIELSELDTELFESSDRKIHRI